jgi:hypothetical protein
VKDIEYFLISLALPTCYIFPRPQGQIPSWTGSHLAAGESVEIISRWEEVSTGCDDDYATLLWNLSSQYEGSKSSISVLWKWPEDESVQQLTEAE